MKEVDRLIRNLKGLQNPEITMQSIFYCSPFPVGRLYSFAFRLKVFVLVCSPHSGIVKKANKWIDFRLIHVKSFLIFSSYASFLILPNFNAGMYTGSEY